VPQGFADIDVVPMQADLANVPQGFVGVVLGDVLDIKFRLVRGVERTWLGGATDKGKDANPASATDWANAANWSPDGAPFRLDTVVVPAGDQSTTDSVRNQANNEFRVRAAGGIKLRTSTAANAAPGTAGNTGCDLPAGSGSWSCASSRDVKENVDEVDGEGVLAKLHDVPVTTWNYITEGREVRHMGPFAQDFYAAFELGTDSTSIGMIDINGVNLAAIKALEQRTSELRAAQAALDERTRRLEHMEHRVAQLEKALQKTRR